MKVCPLLAAALVALTIGGCGASSTQASQHFALADAQNGQSVQVHVGDVIDVSLGSTAWTIDPASDASVLQQQGDQVVAPGSCPPGVGCGTTRATFRAMRSGTARISASRVSCGEAMRCVGQQGVYEVTVFVA